MGLVTALSPFLKVIVWVIGKAMQLISLVWKFLKVIPAALGGGFGAMAGGKSFGSGVEDALGTSEESKALIDTGMGLFGMAEPGQASDAMVTAKAGGGPVSASSPYLVGETGPELFTPSSAGNITPAAETAKALSGKKGGDDMAEIHVHITLDGEKLQDTMYRANLRRQQ
jgi:phage-related minor tail protein